jgi:hypothetical protein
VGEVLGCYHPTHPHFYGINTVTNLEFRLMGVGGGRRFTRIRKQNKSKNIGI